jgi:TPR repeat protein
MRASVIDLKDGRAVESIEFHATGERGVFFLFSVPLFFFVEIVRGPVCKALGERLGKFLTRRDSTSGPSTAATSDFARAAYERGNYATALWLFRRQAERGDADAQFNLGTMYRDGQGVPQDYVQAYVWFTLAATRFAASETEKRSKAIKDREEVAANLTAEQIAEAQRLAHEWRPE